MMKREVDIILWGFLLTQSEQIVIIELGGEFTKTTSLSVRQWWISSALGAIALPVGFLMRFIPIKVSLRRAF